MSNKILFVFEGGRAENQIVTNLQKFFINENTVIKCVYGAEIYQIYKQLVEDKDLDSFNLIKDRNEATRAALDGFSRNDFAEIYMFFDYDGHSTLADDVKLNLLLDFFKEETDKGKLYISYPMVEALKHICDFDTFNDLKVFCKQNIGYKSIAASAGLSEFGDFTRYNLNAWKQLINAHLKKMNYIVHDYFILPGDIISQADIFTKQVEKYICIDSSVAVLSAFPVFLHDYYGNVEIKRRIA